MPLIDCPVILSNLRQKYSALLQESGKKGYLIHSLYLSSEESSLNISGKVSDGDFFALMKSIFFWGTNIPDLISAAHLQDHAKENNLLLVSNLTKEDFFFGTFKKYGVDQADVFPLSSFLVSEVRQLIDHVADRDPCDYAPDSGEWAFKLSQSSKTAELLSSEVPTSLPSWAFLTKSQKEELLKWKEKRRKNGHKIKI